MKRSLCAAAALVLSGGVLVAQVPAATAETTIPKAVNGARVEVTLKTAVERLKVATENRYGYERSKFVHWNDVDRDCQNARAEVLKAESRVATNGGCTVKYGNWFSSYDGLTLKYASDVDIDHMVPLAEAWDSGARVWTAGKRQAYANDLTDPRALIAVSDTSNQSKSDNDPNHWLPARNVCNYVKQWVIVKTRWALTVDQAEKSFLYSTAYKCPRTVLVTHLAKVTNVVYGTTSSTGGGGGSGSCTPGYSPCLPPMSDYDCAGGGGDGPGFANGPIYVTGSDPYNLDGNGDGVGCE